MDQLGSEFLLSELLKWAKAEGLVLNGIQPASIRGCGTGIVACRKLKVVKHPYRMISLHI
jgi:hypothetical protein